MDDLISRQMTIEEWKDDFKGYVNALNIPRDDYNGIMEYIDELPSAQPEPIRCKDCRHNYNCDIQYHAQAGNMFYCGAAERRTDECVD